MTQEENKDQEPQEENKGTGLGRSRESLQPKRAHTQPGKWKRTHQSFGEERVGSGTGSRVHGEGHQGQRSARLRCPTGMSHLQASWWSLGVMRERISLTALELAWEQKEDNGALIMKQPWYYMTGQDGLRPKLSAQSKHLILTSHPSIDRGPCCGWVLQGLWTTQCQHKWAHWQLHSSPVTGLPWQSALYLTAWAPCTADSGRRALTDAQPETHNRHQKLSPWGLLSSRHHNRCILCPTAVPTNMSQRCSLSKGLEMDKLSGKKKLKRTPYN